MKSKNTFKRMLSYTKKYKIQIIISLFCSFIYVFSTIIIPILSGLAIDNMIGANNVNMQKVLIYVLGILISLILGAFFYWLMNYLTGVVTYRIVKDLRKEAMEQLMNVKIKTIDTLPHGEILSKIITDIDIVSDGLIQGFRQFFVSILTILLTLIIMFILCWPLAISVLLLTPLSMLVAYLIAKGSSKSVKKQANLKGELSSISSEYLFNQKTVNLFSYEKEADAKFNEVNNKLDKAWFKAQFYAALINPSTRFVNALIYALVTTLGAIIVIKSNLKEPILGLSLTVGTLFSFLTYASNYTKPFNEISSVIAELQNSLTSMKRIFDLFDEERLPNEDNKLALKECEGNLNIEHVYFSYSLDKPLIEDFNLNVKKGMKIAIVGPTGCGKTTLINLLMRFYDINKGNIYLDNKSIYDLKRNSLRSFYGMVLQETCLFYGTVKENIAYGKNNATEEEIIEAAKKAYAHNFIMQLPKGYDTIISDEEGLSQGQKQLICVARLMLKKPTLLILDEATSSLDTRTELLIQKGFNKIMEGHTSFIIAHRLSTIIDADLILVMKDGKIIETGKHHQLLEKNGFYAKLYNSQFQIH